MFVNMSNQFDGLSSRPLEERLPSSRQYQPIEPRFKFGKGRPVGSRARELAILENYAKSKGIRQAWGR